jgi:osmotically-inducible protein OsmY
MDFRIFNSAPSIHTRRGLVILSLLVAGAVLAGCTGQAQQQDDAVARAVKQTLYDHEPVNLLHVEVSVSQRVAYLSGEVDEYRHKEEAERVARDVRGVLDVVNKVQVQP